MPTLTLTPRPAPVGDRVLSSGSGYEFVAADLHIIGPNYDRTYNVGVRADGTLDGGGFIPPNPGSYSVDVLQNLSKAKNKPPTVTATATVEVS